MYNFMPLYSYNITILEKRKFLYIKKNDSTETINKCLRFIRFTFNT